MKHTVPSSTCLSLLLFRKHEWSPAGLIISNKSCGFNVLDSHNLYAVASYLKE